MVLVRFMAGGFGEETTEESMATDENVRDFQDGGYN